jgi:PAS domain S-box-containing protein
MRILLVDDSMAYQEEFAMILAGSNVKYSALDVALTGSEGSRLLAASIHDIYIIDYRLPGESGLSLIKAAREAGSVKPIIVLTAYDHPDVDAAAVEAGANDYLRKGDFSPEMLGRSIRYAIRNAAAVASAKAAELRFAMAQEAADIGTWEWDIARNTFTWSNRQYANFGLDPNIAGRVTRETWASVIHADDLPSVEAAMTESLISGRPLSIRYRVLFERTGGPGANRPVHWIAARGRVSRDARGQPTHMIGVTIDVTEQQNALNAVRDSRNLAMAGLQISESRFNAYFMNAPECLFTLRVTPDRQFVYDAINPAGLGYIGMTAEMVHGRTPEEVMGPENGGMITAGAQRVFETGSPYLYEPTFKIGASSVIYDAIYMPLCDEQGQVIGVLGSARDVTERRRLEASLRQTQKMEALGQLASGVAHDFNNLLTGMLGCLEMLGKQVTSSRGLTLLAEGRRTVERGAALTSRLLAFSRQQPMLTQPIDFNASIQELMSVLTRTLDGIRIGRQLAQGLWPAVADRNQIELAILNLAINARDAMPCGGAFTIETANASLRRPQDDGLAPGDYVMIRLSDTGTGMAPEVLARALDPFFTTKAEGQGTGLGLSMVYGMVQQLGGTLRIASELGKGTTITILIPRADGEVPTAAAPAPQPPRSASILLVDDDPDTQAAITAYADELGLSVIVAESGSEAMALLDAGGTAEIMIVDTTLPGLSGATLIAEAQARQPELRVVLVSGGGRPAATAAPDATAPIALLNKLFGKDAFSAAVAPLLQPVTNVVKFQS